MPGGGTAEARAQDLDAWEISSFYGGEGKWGNRAQLAIWMNRHRDLEAADYASWAAILHLWQLDAEAWQLLTRHVKEPVFLSYSGGVGSPEALEEHWRAHPEDPVLAMAFAEQCIRRGDPARSQQVILTVAAGKKAAPVVSAKGGLRVCEPGGLRDGREHAAPHETGRVGS